MPQTTNEQLHDAAVRHAIFLERFKGGQRNKLLKILADAEQDVIAKLNDIADPESLSAKRLQRLLRDIQEISLVAAQKGTAELLADLRELGGYEADFAIRSIESAVPVILETVTPSAPQVWAAVNARPFQGRFLKDWVKEYSAQTRNRIAGAVRMGIVEGESIPQIVQRVRGIEGFEGTRRGAQALVRTAVNHTSTVARNEAFEANADILAGLRWNSTLDSRTCLPAGEPIETPDGLRPIEAINPGDTVIGGSGVPRKVAATKSTMTDQVAIVTLSNGQRIRCTPDHLLLSAAQQWVEASELLPGLELADRLK